MIFYCPDYWTPVKKDERVCHECKTDIEPLDHQKSYFEKWINALNHPERATRIRVAYILGELGDRGAIKPFEKVVSKANRIQDVFFIETIAMAIGKVGGNKALPILIRLMEHPSFLVRRVALHSLRNFRNEEAIKAINKALKDASPNVREPAQKILQTQ